MRKILVINPNISVSMTQEIKRSAEAVRALDTILEYRTGREGPEVIENNLEDFLSAIEVLKIIAQESDSYDAFIIAASPDPGLLAARELTTKPVLGIGESPIILAALLGRRFSILGHWKGDKPRSEDKVKKYHMSELMASVVTINARPLNIHEDQKAKSALLAERGRDAIDDDGAEVLVLTGAAFAGMHKELSIKLGVPVLEGIACAVKLAELAIDLGLFTTRVGQYSPVPHPKHLEGFLEFTCQPSFVNQEHAQG